MSAYKDEEKECVITRLGQANIFKQGNGFKYAIMGYALVKDPTKWIYNKCTDDDINFDFNALRDLTWQDLKDNCRIVFNGVSYSYDNDLHRPDVTQYEAAKKNPGNYLFPVNLSHNYDENANEEEIDNTYASYDVILDPKLINVSGVTGDQTFDAVIYFARPYMNEEQDDDLDILDPQTPIVFAIEYFATDKLMILKDQEKNLVMNVKLHVSYRSMEVKSIQKFMPENYNESGMLQGLHIYNDASTNTISTDAESYGTTNKLFISTLPETNAAAYDAFAKLNIMSLATSAVSASTPQLMLSLVNDNYNKTWNGNRLAFNYASGDAGSLFRIHEVKGTAKQRLNFELLGQNNLYRNVKGAWGNSFIYSQDNEIPTSAYNNFFLNSDGNELYPHQVNNMSFIDSDFNIVQSGTPVSGRYPGVNGITFFGTSDSIITPSFTIKSYKGVKAYKGYKGYKGHKGIKGIETTMYYSVGGYLQQHFLLDSDNTYINGHNNRDFHGTYISSPSAKHTFNEYSQHDLELGNMLGFTYQNSGNFIGIGRGLNYIKGQNDKIVLGNFNMNDTDPSNVLIVGDGFMTQDYLSSISGMLSASNSNDKFFAAFSGRGDMINWYRHNLLTVNRDGWIGISDYSNPSNSARYGVKGITAYNNGATYEIPFAQLYSKLNVYDSMQEFQNQVDDYTVKVRSIVNACPTNKSIVITGATTLDSYFGKEISAIGSNSLINVTYQTTATKTDAGFTTTVRAPYMMIGEVDGTRTLIKKYTSNTISAYNSIQYLYLRDTENNLTGFFKINN